MFSLSSDSPIRLSREYSPLMAFSRKLTMQAVMTSDEWMDWFASDGLRAIRWTVPWWELANPILEVVDSWHVQL